MQRNDVSFRHNVQSLRVVERIEHAGEGLNLTPEVRDGIVCHTGSTRAETLEGRVVALSDRIAYVNHDIDDAVRAGLLTPSELPAGPLDMLGTTHSERVENLVVNAVQTSAALGDIAMSSDAWEAMNDLRTFLFHHVYHHESVLREADKARRLVCSLFTYFVEHPSDVPQEYRVIAHDDTIRAVTDYVAGMTDRYAVRLYEELFVPRPFGR